MNFELTQTLNRVKRVDSYSKIGLAPVAQRIERWPPEPEVGGSNPLGRAIKIPKIKWR